jgi:hypothetical protein
LPNIIDITDIIDVLIERRQRLVTPRSVFPRRPSSVPAATARAWQGPAPWRRP